MKTYGVFTFYARMRAAGVILAFYASKPARRAKRTYLKARELGVDPLDAMKIAYTATV